MLKIRIAILALFIGICTNLSATVVKGKIADAHMRAVSGATIDFQLVEVGHGTRPITFPQIQSSYRVITRCDGSFRLKLTGNGAITATKTLWQVRISAPGFYLSYNFLVTGQKLDLNIMGPRGTLSPKAKFYWGVDTPPFSYSFGCHIRRVLGAVL